MSEVRLGQHYPKPALAWFWQTILSKARAAKRPKHGHGGSQPSDYKHCSKPDSVLLQHACHSTEAVREHENRSCSPAQCALSGPTEEVCLSEAGEFLLPVAMIDKDCRRRAFAMNT
eukprot:1554015-Amphidinium_carterae.2